MSLGFPQVFHRFSTGFPQPLRSSDRGAFSFFRLHPSPKVCENLGVGKFSLQGAIWTPLPFAANSRKHYALNPLVSTSTSPMSPGCVPGSHKALGQSTPPSGTGSTSRARMPGSSLRKKCSLTGSERRQDYRDELNFSTGFPQVFHSPFDLRIRGDFSFFFTFPLATWLSNRLN